MSQMIKQLYTAGGPLKLVYLPYFVNCITKVMMDDLGQYVHYPVIRNSMGGVVYNNFECTQPVIEQLTVKTRNFKTITNYDVLKLTKGHRPGFSDYNYLIEGMLEEGIHNAITEDFKVIVAQTTPAFFLKDLNINALQDLANKYHMEYGEDGAFGIEMSLSPFQKYFIIASAENFKFHFNHYRDASCDATQARGCLVNYAPQKMIMGRYENLEYMKELSAMNMVYKNETD